MPKGERCKWAHFLAKNALHFFQTSLRKIAKFEKQEVDYPEVVWFGGPASRDISRLFLTKNGNNGRTGQRRKLQYCQLHCGESYSRSYCPC